MLAFLILQEMSFAVSDISQYFLADRAHIVAVCGDCDVCGVLIFRGSLRQQALDVFHIHIPLKQRPVVKIFYPFVDGLRGCAEVNDFSAQAHGGNVFLAQGHAAAAGDDRIGFLLQ